ncbi:MAG: TonB-dependent outer membrane protein SusC/RagA, partial [Gemmatimonadetes bacterium]|nr:TonB-dependent outer membrane protein SusC/RagA [Gemmatimonadota bacterium]
AMGLARPATAQQRITVTGTVTSADGAPLPGVTVSLQGTDTRAITGGNGRYLIPNIVPEGVLRFTLVGRRSVETSISGRTRVDVSMQRVAYLEEVVVTSYAEQRRADITGAVASVPIETINRETGASVLQKLAAVTPGVTVEASGSPGSRSTVRIRGISSFQNNDPLYVVDGTPVQDTYINWLNPDDITSIQVLKDASAASIYGARASNGVVVIETTKKGMNGPPRSTLRLRTGMASPVRGYDDFLINNSLDYFQVVKQSYINAGLPVPTNIYGSVTNPTVPGYIWPNNCGAGGSTGPCSTVDPSTYAYPSSLIMPASNGTDWWSAVFGSAPVRDVNLDVGGGSPDNTYGVSFNYYNQGGTARYNNYQRGTVRANTEFRRGKLTFGENLAVGLERSYGGQADDNFGENTIIGKNILMQPVVPLYDINGNFASGKAVGLGNNTNPLKLAYEARNNLAKNNRVFGNAFAGVSPIPELTVRTRFGFNVGQGGFNGYTAITPENSEPTLTNSIFENENQFTDWTWSNTAQYLKSFSQHTINVLVGQEANAGNNRFITASIANLLNTDPNSRYINDALGDAKSKNVSSTGGQYALLSFFGKADYSFEDKYVLSATVRADGSSRLGPTNRWGTFPAFGLGWRVSNESFLRNNPVFNDVMLRYGWGVTGNQLIPAGRIVSQFGGSTGETFYDITGSNSNIQPGFRQTSLGNPDLKWEEDRSQNLGADLSLFNRNLDIVVDVYKRTTSNLLFNPALPATAGGADAPFVNIGSVQNKGFDFSIGHQGSWWNATFNGSHYKNQIITIDGVQNFFYGPIGVRFGNPIINQVGSPIGAFYGYVADGYFQDAADVTSHATQAGAAPGRIKFRDLNGDGKIDLNDRTVIGSPHPNFTAGLDLGARWHNFDVASTVFGTFGNKIFDAQKQFYVFRNFSTNVVQDLLANSWTPTNPNAKYPRLDVNDTYSYALSSYYVEDGSYIRLRSLQVGYTIPQDARWVGRSLSGMRVYLLGENLFTHTNYPGLDPALPAQFVERAAGDVRDQFRGVDQGTYPSNRVFSIGLVTSF